MGCIRPPLNGAHSDSCQTYKPEDIIRMAWRRKWAIVAPLVLVAAGTVVWSHLLPDIFQSDTSILVLPQRVPESYCRSTVTALIEDRLQSISQQILSRSSLEPIVHEFDLYPGMRERRAREDVVERMHRSIEIQTIRGDAFRLEYTSTDPQKVKPVTEHLASMFIEETLLDREVLAEGTSQFLESQLEDACARLVGHEKKLEAYRLRHAGELPSQLQSNLQVLRSNLLQMQALIESLYRNLDRRILTERSLADLLAADTAAGSSLPPTQGEWFEDPVNRVSPGTGTGRGRMDVFGDAPAVQQLAAAERALLMLELRLTEDHPDIGRMKRRIRQLEARVDAETLQTQPSELPGTSPETTEQVARQNRILAIQAELDNLNRQIASEEADYKRLQDVLATYHRRVEAVPSRETELTELMRDYQTLQGMYTTLLTKKEDTKIAADLERRQIGEQFKVLYPARLPERPFSSIVPA